MNTPLTHEEIQALQRLIGRIEFANGIRFHDEVEEAAVPPAPEMAMNSSLSGQRLARQGAHHLALHWHGDAMCQDENPTVSLSVAISALLWDEQDLALQWAEHCLSLMESVGFRNPSKNMWYWGAVEIMRLTKVFRALGRAEMEQRLRNGLNGFLPQLEITRDPGIESLRLAIELGWENEAEAFIGKLAPLVVGHSRGPLLHRLFRTLMDMGKLSMVWAMFGVLRDEHDEYMLRLIAIEEACKRGDYLMASRLANKLDLKEMDHVPIAYYMANWIVKEGKVEDWPVIWAIGNGEPGVRHQEFRDDTLIHFLARWAEHVPTTDKLKLLDHSKTIFDSYRQGGYGNIGTVAFLHLVVAAWADSVEEIEASIGLATPIRVYLATLRRAMVKHELGMLMPIFAMMESGKRVPDQGMLLDLELSRWLAGKENRLEESFHEEFGRALTNRDEAKIQSLIHFVGRQWRNLPLYRDLLHKHPSTEVGLSMVDLWPILNPIKSAGDILGFEMELARVNEANCLSEAWWDLEICLGNRIGLRKRIEDF